MDTFNYSTLVLAWVGLVCASVLGAGTLYVWALWTIERLVERAPWPVGLYRAVKAAIQVSITPKKEAFAAHYVCEKIAEAENESPTFADNMARFLPARHNRNF